MNLSIKVIAQSYSRVNNQVALVNSLSNTTSLIDHLKSIYCWMVFVYMKPNGGILDYTSKNTASFSEWLIQYIFKYMNF